MTAAVAVALVVLALTDGAFAGFRSAQGRTGLVDHRRADVVAQLRGLVLAAVLLLPVAALVVLDGGWTAWTDAGAAMLVVYLPYGGLVLLALVAYLTLPWRWRYLATALILGPFTWARPAVAVAGGAVGVLAADRVVVALGVVASVVAVLVVPALCERWGRTPLTRAASVRRAG